MERAVREGDTGLHSTASALGVCLCNRLLVRGTGITERERFAREGRAVKPGLFRRLPFGHPDGQADRRLPLEEQRWRSMPWLHWNSTACPPIPRQARGKEGSVRPGSPHGHGSTAPGEALRSEVPCWPSIRVP